MPSVSLVVAKLCDYEVTVAGRYGKGWASRPVITEERSIRAGVVALGVSGIPGRWRHGQTDQACPQFWGLVLVKKKIRHVVSGGKCDRLVKSQVRHSVQGAMGSTSRKRALILELSSLWLGD